MRLIWHKRSWILSHQWCPASWR